MTNGRYSARFGAFGAFRRVSARFGAFRRVSAHFGAFRRLGEALSRGVAQQMTANYSREVLQLEVNAYLLTVGVMGAPNRADQPLIMFCTVPYQDRSISLGP